VGLTDDPASEIRPGGPQVELARLSEDLRLSRLELAQARDEQEKVVEEHLRVRRARTKAQKESDLLAKALADVLHDQTKERAAAAWWQLRRGRVTRTEWEQVLNLRRSKHFRPGWYLRQNPDVARAGIDPALHFLRNGHREGRDPGPGFDVKKYVKQHPEVRQTGDNPLLHFLRGKSELSRGRGGRPDA